MSATDYSNLHSWLARVSRSLVYAPSLRRGVLRVEKAGQTSLLRGMVQTHSKARLIEWHKHPDKWKACFLGSEIPTFETYAIVRNPWDRAVSNWSHMRSRGRTRLNFDKFVQTQAWKAFPFGPWMQFRPCSWWTHEQGEQMVDHVFRFEDYAVSARKIAMAMGVPESVEVPHQNATEHKPYREYYDDATRAIIAEQYQEDIANYDYSF